MITHTINKWNYFLNDGINPSIELRVSIGTLIDATTGLIYIGNGQYYDPETGRFLTRGVNPNSPNPYVPFNPMGVVLGPLALVSGSYVRKKTKNAPKWLSILTLLLLSCVTASAVGMAFNSCWNIVFSGNSTPETPGGNGGVEGGMTSIPAPISTPSTPTPTPTYTDPCDNNQCTPTPSVRIKPIVILGCGFRNDPCGFSDYGLRSYYDC